MAADKQPPFSRRLGWRLEALAFDVFTALVRLMPVDVASNLGAALLGWIGPKTKVQQTVDNNMRLAFPEMSAAERQALALIQWKNFGRFCAEFTMVDRLTPSAGRLECVGGEHLARILMRGEPAVFVTGHFANFEVMAAGLADAGIDCMITYRPANNPYIEDRITETRRQYGLKYFAPKGMDGGREVLDALKRGQSVGMLVDQKYNQGIKGLFFGHVAPTNSVAVQIALRTGAHLIAASIERVDGARFRSVIHPPLQLQRTKDRAADLVAGVDQLNAFIEARVRERPQDWFWVHKRWGDKAYATLKDEG
jgi:Kdo2-lipid IVA lauroyltransferase/acyltransferase